jgi:ATP-dependent protease ClpP protease subunit
MSKFWEIQQKAELPGVLELYIYSDVQGDYFDIFTWQMKKSETSAEYFREQLEAHPNVSEIRVYINSLGGSVMEGVAIYNQLRRHPAHKTVYVDGFACSVASVIAMAGDKIVMPRNTVMMIHNAWAAVSGNAQELRKMADDLDVLNAASRQAYLLKAGDKLTEEKLTEMLDAETYLTAEQCISYGLADEYAEQDVDINAAAGMLQQAKENSIHQHTTHRLEQICAKAQPQEPTPPEPETSKAADIITSYFK